MEFDLDEFLQHQPSNMDLLTQAVEMEINDQQPVQPSIQQPVMLTVDQKILDEVQKMNNDQETTMKKVIEELKTFNQMLVELKSLNTNVVNMNNQLQKMMERRTAALSTPVKVPIHFDFTTESFKDMIVEVADIMKHKRSRKRKSPEEKQKTTEEKQKPTEEKADQSTTQPSAYRKPSVTGRGIHSKDIETCKIKKKKL